MASAKRKSQDWKRLHAGVKGLYELHGKGRQAAVLENFKDRKEAICRKLGIVGEADLVRISRQLEIGKSGL